MTRTKKPKNTYWSVGVYVRVVHLVSCTANLSPADLFRYPDEEDPNIRFFERMILFITRDMTGAAYAELGWMCKRSLDSVKRSIGFFENEIRTKKHARDWLQAALHNEDFEQGFIRGMRRTRSEWKGVKNEQRDQTGCA